MQLYSVVHPLVRLPSPLFCNLRKSLARSCIHIFLATGRADLRGDIPNYNGRFTSGKCDRCGPWFSPSILVDDTLHERFPLVFIRKGLDTAPALSLYTFSCTI